MRPPVAFGGLSGCLCWLLDGRGSASPHQRTGLPVTVRALAEQCGGSSDPRSRIRCLDHAEPSSEYTPCAKTGRPLVASCASSTRCWRGRPAPRRRSSLAVSLSSTAASRSSPAKDWWSTTIGGATRTLTESRSTPTAPGRFEPKEHLLGRRRPRIERATVAEKNELLFQRGTNFNALPSWQKRGRGISWNTYEKKALNPKMGEATTATRRQLEVNLELPQGEEDTSFLLQRVREATGENDAADESSGPPVCTRRGLKLQHRQCRVAVMLVDSREVREPAPRRASRPYRGICAGRSATSTSVALRSRLRLNSSSAVATS